MKKQRVLTGTRSSGKPHLGNYFGAYAKAIELQETFDLFFFIADFHSLNSHYRPEELRQYTLDLLATLLALGLDPEKSCFYSQSGVPEVTELMWMLSCHAPMGLLNRAHGYKDALAKGLDVNNGLFQYPVLMAADILLFDADVVPVGPDQKQHLEIARDLATRFNNFYGEHLVLPEPLIDMKLNLVPGIDGEKMSKSKNNVIPLFASDKAWKKAISSIVTDSKGVDEKKDPETCFVYKIYSLFADPTQLLEMAEKYRSGGYGYGHAKMDLLEALKNRFSETRDRYDDWANRPDDLIDVLKSGSAKARVVAQAKMARLHKTIGFIL